MYIMYTIQAKSFTSLINHKTCTCTIVFIQVHNIAHQTATLSNTLILGVYALGIDIIMFCTQHALVLRSIDNREGISLQGTSIVDE